MNDLTQSRRLPVVLLTGANLFPPFAWEARPLVPAQAARQKAKAPGGWRTPRRWRVCHHHRPARSVLDCGGPPPLFSGAAKGPDNFPHEMENGRTEAKNARTDWKLARTEREIVRTD
jgi:hypothetical protein